MGAIVCLRPLCFFVGGSGGCEGSDVSWGIGTGTKPCRTLQL